MKNANYRKHNDGTHNSSTYHKKDGTPIRAILKREAQREIDESTGGTLAVGAGQPEGVRAVGCVSQATPPGSTPGGVFS